MQSTAQSRNTIVGVIASISLADVLWCIASSAKPAEKVNLVGTHHRRLWNG
jgi:hypothetical protein